MTFYMKPNFASDVEALYGFWVSYFTSSGWHFMKCNSCKWQYLCHGILSDHIIIWLQYAIFSGCKLALTYCNQLSSREYSCDKVVISNSYESNCVNCDQDYVKWGT